jgi:ketosteroid isomerase-like protein
MAVADTQTALENVRAHMAAEDRQDVEAAVACFTEDCYYEVPGIGVRLDGRDQIKRWYEDLFTAVPDFRNVDERQYVIESEGRTTIFHESKFAGTHTGDWMGWAPTNRFFETAMLVRIPIADDGLMEAEIVYQDCDADAALAAHAVTRHTLSTSRSPARAADRRRRQLGAEPAVDELVTGHRAANRIPAPRPWHPRGRWLD